MLKISVITTVRNGGHTIRDCLQSVQGQTHGAVEHIVVDGASTDATAAILAAYRDRLATVVSEPDRGIYDGMNKGLALATGEVIGILNADDLYAGPEVLADVARVFAEKGVDSCYGDLVYVAEEDDGGGGRHAAINEEPAGQSREGKRLKVVRYWRSGEFALRKFYWGWMPPHPTFFLRRAVYERCGGFNLELGTAADYELMLRLLVKHRISCGYLPEILIKMRAGGASNVTLKARLRANRMDRKAWTVNGLTPYPWTLWLKPLRKLGQWVARPG